MHRPSDGAKSGSLNFDSVREIMWFMVSCTTYFPDLVTQNVNILIGYEWLETGCVPGGSFSGLESNESENSNKQSF